MSELNKQVASLIEANMPCGTCNECLEVAAERFFEVYGRSSPDFESRFLHLIEVAEEVEKTEGTADTVTKLALKIVDLMDWSAMESVEFAALVLGHSIRWKKKFQIKQQLKLHVPT